MRGDGRRRFTAGFVVGRTVRALAATPLLAGVAAAYNSPRIRGAVRSRLASALAGLQISRRSDVD